MSYLQFKGVNDYGDFTITDEIQYGLQTYFEWGFLNIGAFDNIEMPLRNEKQKIEIYCFTNSGTKNYDVIKWGNGVIRFTPDTGIPIELMSYPYADFSSVYPMSGIFHHYSPYSILELNGGYEGIDVNSGVFERDAVRIPNTARYYVTDFVNTVYGDAGAEINPEWEATMGTYHIGDFYPGSPNAPVASGFGWLTLQNNFGSGSVAFSGLSDITPITFNIGGIDYNIFSTNTSGIKIVGPSWLGGSSTLNVTLDSKIGQLLHVDITELENGRNYESDAHILRPVPNPNYTTARVWEGYRNNWVWESGLSCATKPIEISGIFVNNTFMENNNSQYKVDYPNGRIIFNDPIAASSTVMCEYSYKRIKFTNSDSLEGRALHHRSLEIDNQFMQYSGTKVEFERNKVQLPAVAIEMIPKKRFPKGTQLGGGHYLEQSLLMHVFAETPQERNKILDIIVNQHDSNIVIYDMNKLAEDNMFPINLDGNIVNQSTRNYNNLVGVDSSYGYRQGIFKNIESQEQNIIVGNLFGGIAKVVIELGIPNV